MLRSRSKLTSSAEVGISPTTYEPSKTDHLQALNQVVRGAILSDGTFKSYVFFWGCSGYRELTILRILYQIRKLNTYNPERDGAINHSAITNTTPGPHSHLACQTLDLLLSRLLGQPPIAQTWVEKIVVTRLWISSLSLHVQDHPSKLGNLFDDVARTNGTRLGLEATHAAQSVSGKSHFLHHPKNRSDIMIADMESRHCLAAVIGRR
jgi:hypothetical protein